ncbi:glycosyltransferase [uncultured Roseobacter sp.]|uniref:glycosyltransferase family protein n=1 Tax=uncultured Roseobacter sp. TaxID=114847 RepID=UPI0026381C09|nr:glycosyltransferase [uncultured Roseobacter sp.]
MKVVILVTHLLGTGHLARALTLARAFSTAGHEATVLSGGMPAQQLDSAGIRLVQLPPLRSDGVNFTRLLDADGGEASEDLMQRRATHLRDTLQSIAPDVVITELFPFGRRVLRTEFLGAVETAISLPQRPMICASVRDILAPPSKPAKAAMTEDTISRFYDAVLVHSDADVTPLDISWPVTKTLAPYLHYTGFVAPPLAPPHPDGAGTGEVLVSAGGGNVGTNVFDAALQAARHDPDRRWRLLVGGNKAADRIATLRPNAPPNTIVEPARPDFRQMLHHAAASVSMAGYNTALDLLQTQTPAVLVPFDAGDETEQSLRAVALERLPGIEVLTSAALNGQMLLDRVQQAINAPRRAARATGFDGAHNTVRIVQKLANKHHAG